MAMRLPSHHFDCWCGTVYHTVRGKQARLTTTGALVIEIGVIVKVGKQKGVTVNMIQTWRCFGNFERKRCSIVKKHYEIVSD
jgi:hypothetical protein